jgi:Stage II sporulation protein E (SpoIIE)
MFNWRSSSADPSSIELGSRRSSFLRTMPIRRMGFLLLAVFCLFAMYGFLIDIMDVQHKTLLAVIIWTVFTGFTAVAFILVLSRAPRYFIVVIAAHWILSRTVIGPFIRRYVNRPSGDLANVSPEHILHIAGLSSMALAMIACVFFLVFIHREGKRAVRMETELSLAHGIQKTLVPTISTTLDRCEIYGRTIPSDEVGGDLVDAVSLQDGSSVVYVADIAGHGMAAGILMGMVKTAVRTQLFDQPTLAQLFDRLNRVLPSVKEQHMYATCAALHMKKAAPDGIRDVEYAVAAHTSILYVAGKDRKVSRLTDQHLPLGLLPYADYSSHSFAASPGDVLLVSTDGILETENKNTEDFGMDRLQQALLAQIEKPLPQIGDAIFEAVRSFGPQEDDRTLLLVRFL